MADIEPYENTLSVDELRRELRYYLDLHYGILHALRDVPEFPSPFVLMHLGTVAKYPDDHNRGKELQREYPLSIIPPKHECEGGAGLWERIRRGLADEQKGTPALDQQKWGYPNHPGVVGPCDFPDGSKWSGFEWTRPPRKYR